jgi:putative membrane protein
MGWIIGAIIAFFLLAAVLAWIGFAWYGTTPTYVRMYPGYMYFPFFFPFGILFFFLAIFVIVRLVFWRSWGWGYWGRRAYYGMDSKEILKRRYARGEITKDQFEQMLRDIEQH